MKRATFRFERFSARQLKVLTWWCAGSPVREHDGIIADGAIRSGKTLSMSLSFAIWAMSSFNEQNFGMCGKTIGSFRRNVLVSLKRMLSARGFLVEDRRGDNLMIVRRGDVENYFYIFGGKDERSQDLIQGVTLAGVFFDEVALMPESFVNQATGRCSVDGSKFWFNCNPEWPEHWFRAHWILKCKEKRLLYLHFTMEDNPSLTERVKERYRAIYSGVFYDRYILGEWCVAEGLVFPYFGEDSSPFLTDSTGDKFQKISIGLDFGGTGSLNTMVAVGISGRYDNIEVLREACLPRGDRIDTERIANACADFCASVREHFGRYDFVFYDAADPALGNRVAAVLQTRGLPSRNVVASYKVPLEERPVTVDGLLCSGRLKINRTCAGVIRALTQLRWDEAKPNIPEDKNIGNINDYWDAFCYAWSAWWKYFDRRAYGREKGQVLP